MGDVETLQYDIVGAVRATVGDTQRFESFAKEMLGEGYEWYDEASLKSEMEAYTIRVDARLKRSLSSITTDPIR